MHKLFLRSFALSASLLSMQTAFAAQPVNLSKQPLSILKAYVKSVTFNAAAGADSERPRQDQLLEIRRNTDNQKITHIRVQQQHQGYPVWGADAVIHVPKQLTNKRALGDIAASGAIAGATMNGVIYQNLASDLQNVPQQVFSKEQALLAMRKVNDLVHETYGNSEIRPVVNKLIVYVDQENKAHFAYLISVYLNETAKDQVPAKPTYILDAMTFNVYKSWNDMRSAHETASGGGFGGNRKNNEKIEYDGLTGHLKALRIAHDPLSATCLMQNDDVELRDGRGKKDIMSYRCLEQSAEHNHVFWNGSMDEVNGGYSPANDALFAGSVVQELYQQWLGVPMLKKRDGTPMVLKMFVHVGNQWENAEWDPDKEEVRLGDGKDTFYPLTSLGIVAHEVSHGFTSQHSNLVYADQSGSMDEAYSDMSAQAAELFATGQNTWQIGADVVKENNAALRYMDRPSKDCNGRRPGDACSIDDASQYPYLEQTSYEYTKKYNEFEREAVRQSYIVHLGSGVFNRAYYLLSTMPGWDAKKAFVVMAEANANYWTQNSSFQEGACGVMKAAEVYHYDTAAVGSAFNKVGIDTRQC